VLFRLIDSVLQMALASNPTTLPVRYAEIEPSLLNLLERLTFDADWYSRLYSDVNPAVTAGLFVSPRDHFLKRGGLAGRCGAPMVVDEEWYAVRYPDVARATQSGHQLSLQTHFRNHGFFEGRAATQGDEVESAWYHSQAPTAAIQVELGLYRNLQDHYNKIGYGLGLYANETASLGSI
jgi:hypothetical protein